jgi:hypothetical protein
VKFSPNILPFVHAINERNKKLPEEAMRRGFQKVPDLSLHGVIISPWGIPILCFHISERIIGTITPRRRAMPVYIHL